MKTETGIEQAMRVMRGRRGRVYWSDNGQVRVWLTGRFLDVGFHTLEGARAVADALEFQFVAVGQPGACVALGSSPRSNGLSGLRTQSRET